MCLYFGFLPGIAVKGRCWWVFYFVERATGIEPAFTAWEAVVLPMNYARKAQKRFLSISHMLLAQKSRAAGVMLFLRSTPETAHRAVSSSAPHCYAMALFLFGVLLTKPEEPIEENLQSPR